MDFKIGDRVRTCKGAQFRGVIIGFHDLEGQKPGCVIEAIDDGFKGTRHVYPLGQIEFWLG